MTDLYNRVRAWIREDPDPATRAELQQLLDAAKAADPAARADLADRFSGPLEFGTAGLRGALGAGPHRMNRAVVIRAAAGLAAYLRQQGDTRPVVIGYDARHNSEVFARDTAEVFTGAGFEALVMPRPLPTPVLAFAIGDLHCSAGVMVTASHNPAQDNGYKVYLGDGSQIVPPADTMIAAAIAAVGTVSDVPRGGPGRPVDEAVIARYEETAAAVVGAGPRDLAMVYTPIHGVGRDTVLTVLATAGFAPPAVPPAQADPDPEFPTTAFPNPEEPGVMDLAIDLARQTRADIVVANDPDADRCAVAVPIDDDATAWRMLHGDEVGALLADHLLRRGRTGVYARSIVSSSLLARLAAAHDQPHTETLTGFKWIGRVPGLAFGYEEALGYCVDPAHIRDKDGITALLLVAEVAAAAKAEGRTLLDLLDDIAVRHGLHATDQLSVRFDDPTLMPATMQRLRDAPPSSLGGFEVQRVDDLATGVDGLPATDGLRFVLQDGARVIVRPSGTEPKIKCYLEVIVPVEQATDDPTRAVSAARITAAGRLDALRLDIAAAAGL